MGKTLWGTTRGHLANAIRGVTQGWRKELGAPRHRLQGTRRPERRGSAARRRARGAQTARPKIRSFDTTRAQALQSRRTCRAAGP